MTSRQRILAALNHQEPDRVPVDFSGHRSSGIAPLAYARLRRAIGLPEVSLRVYDPLQQLAIVDEVVLDLLGADTGNWAAASRSTMPIGRTGCCRMGLRA